MRTGASPHSVSPAASMIRAEYPTPCDATAAVSSLAEHPPQQDCASCRTARPADLGERPLHHPEPGPTEICSRSAGRRTSGTRTIGCAPATLSCRQHPDVSGPASPSTSHGPVRQSGISGRRGAAKRAVQVGIDVQYRPWTADDANTWHGGRSTRRCGLHHDSPLALERIGNESDEGGTCSPGPATTQARPTARGGQPPRAIRTDRPPRRGRDSDAADGPRARRQDWRAQGVLSALPGPTSRKTSPGSSASVSTRLPLRTGIGAADVQRSRPGATSSALP